MDEYFKMRWKEEKEEEQEEEDELEKSLRIKKTCPGEIREITFLIGNAKQIYYKVIQGVKYYFLSHDSLAR